MLGLPLDMQAEVQAATGVKRHEPKPIGRAHKAWLKRAIPGLSESDQALANDIFGFRDLDGDWFINLDAVVAYWNEHGKLPSSHSTDDAVRRLGLWVNRQRQNEDLAPDRRALIMERCPAILVNATRATTWEQSLSETAEYLQVNGELPSKNSANKTVKKLGGWIGSQRQNENLTAERRARIMEQCPAVFADSGSGTWERCLAETSEYWRQNGKLPSQHSGNATVRKLGIWVQTQRKKGNLPSELREKIMEQCPAILVDATSAKAWGQWLSEVAGYWRKHGKLPSSKSQDPHTKKLGNWVSVQRRNKSLSPERRTSIIEQCPTIFAVTGSGAWERSLASAADYWRQHGKLPSRSSGDEAVRSLGVWVGKQRSNKNLSPERRAAIMEQCPAILAGR